MTIPTVIFAGAGDLAARAMALFAGDAAAPHCVAIARTLKQLQAAEFWQGALASPSTLARIIAAKPQVIVVTLVPNGAGEAGYQQGYVEPLQHLVKALQAAQQKPCVVFASSTAVYHQHAGEWVDEQAATLPEQYAGQCLLRAEQLLAASGLPYCCVRFGGIYGPGRDYLIRQVQAGQGGGPEYTNRIHQDDAARCLYFLTQRFLTGQINPPVVVACDNSPVSSQEVRTFIAGQLGLDPTQLQPSVAQRGGNKRCANAQLRALGFTFTYPNYKQGYGNLDC